jgi:hypothetical protein
MKPKEVDKSRTVWFSLAALLVLFLVYFYIGTASFTLDSVTGSAVYTGNLDMSEVTAQVEKYAQSMYFLQEAGTYAEICLLINTPRNVLSFDILKSPEGIKVRHTPFSRYCDNDPQNKGPEDFVLKYVSYEKFLEHAKNPSCEVIKQGGRGEHFYYLPSEFIEEGGKVKCDPYFEERYCPGINKCATKDEMKQHARCCLDKNFITAMPGVLGTYWFWLIILVLFTTLLVLFVLLHKEKRKLLLKRGALKRSAQDIDNYVHEGLQKGYSYDEIRANLVNQHWNTQFVDKVLEKYTRAKKK